jgi:4-diphosphocytidyl-2-C-methyl-D-erythritol kinase
MLITEQAHAKINLGLHVLGRRLDGYHELDSVVAFADVCDVLTLEPASSLALALSGPFARDLHETAGNTVVHAWHALSQATELPPVRFHLEKNLPVASGIGGGSADAAAALRGLIRLFNLEIPVRQLNGLALKLGADVPVCLASQTSRMQGIGEILAPLAMSIPRAALLVNPRKPSPTARVFEVLGLGRGQVFGSPVEDVEDVKSWRNDLEGPAIRVVPEIAMVIGALTSQPNLTCVRMSGSGATCFGLCDGLAQAEAAAVAIRNQHPDWWVVATGLAPKP